MYKLEYVLKRPTLETKWYQQSEERTEVHKEASQIFHDWLKEHERVEAHSTFSSDGLTYKWTMVFDDEEHYLDYENQFRELIAGEPFNGLPITSFPCLLEYHKKHGIECSLPENKILAEPFEV